MFLRLENFSNGLALCPKVRGNPETIGKHVMELAGAVSCENMGKGSLLKVVTQPVSAGEEQCHTDEQRVAMKHKR